MWRGTHRRLQRQGVIASDASDESDRVVAVMAVRSSTVRFEPVRVGGYAEDPAGCGRALAAALNPLVQQDARAVLVFPDGLLGNCTEMLRAFSAALRQTVPVVGGAAGDALEFERTYQYLDGDAATNAVTAVLISGSGQFVIDVSHGCEAVGTALQITAADGGWVRAINGRPAWDVYKEFLDGDPQDLNAEGMAHLSLAIEGTAGAPHGHGHFTIRTPLQLDKSDGALFFPGGSLEAGMTVRVARRDQEWIRETARASADVVRAVSRIHS